MSKKMKIPSIFKSKSEAKQPWQWSSCKHPKTLSFRAGATNDDIFKTVNSVFLHTSDVGLETPESWFTNSSECASTTFSTDDVDHSDDYNVNASSAESLEMIIRGVRSSERLFFEPGDTSSILKETKKNGGGGGGDDYDDSGSVEVLPFRESVALAMESDDPYLDFKKSMEEMVESHGIKDWDCLEELLGWYLKMNGKNNHGFIVGAFVDMLVGLANDNTSPAAAVCNCSDESSYSSADSSFSCPSSPVSPTGGGEIAIDHHEEGDVINAQSYN